MLIIHIMYTSIIEMLSYKEFDKIILLYLVVSL